jgi:hypothetical protein
MNERHELEELRRRTFAIAYRMTIQAIRIVRNPDKLRHLHPDLG